MTPTIVPLQEVLDNHPTLSPSVRAFCEGLLTQGDMLAVTADYFPHLLLWLVTTPWQARLMREAPEPPGSPGPADDRG